MFKLAQIAGSVVPRNGSAPSLFLFITSLIGFLSCSAMARPLIPLVILGIAAFPLAKMIPTVGSIASGWTFNRTVFAFYLFFVFQDIIILNMDRFGIPLGSLFKKSDELIILAMSMLVCYRRIMLGQPVRLHLILLFPALLTIWALMSQIVNDVPRGVAFLDIFLMAKGFLIFMIALNVDIDAKTLKSFFKANMMVALVTVVIEFIQIPFPAVAEAVFGVEPMYRSGSIRPTGPFEHPGTLGTFLGFNLCMFFGFAHTFKSRRILIYYGATIVALVLSLTIRQFTGHFLGMVLFLLIRDRQTLRKFMLVALIGLPLSTPIIIKNIENLKKNDVGYTGDTVRVQSYKIMGRIMEDKPIFGEGPGRFGGYVSIVTNSPVLGEQCFDFLNQELYSLDAYWPTLFGELGYVGGAIFLLFIITAYIQSLMLTKEGLPPTIKAMGMCCAIALPMGLCDATVAPFFENTFAMLLMMSQLGLMCAMNIDHKAKLQIRRRNLKPNQ